MYMYVHTYIYMYTYMSIYIYVCLYIYMYITHKGSCKEAVPKDWNIQYGVATFSRIDKSIVSFAEYSLFYRALLQKRPMILPILLTKVNPYEVADMSIYVFDLLAP